MLRHLLRNTTRSVRLRSAPTTRAALFHSSTRTLQVSAQQIRTKLQAQFPDSDLIDVDDARKLRGLIEIASGDGSFFHITVISKQFEGKNLLEQHKLVNSVLKDDMAKIHGVTITTSTKKPRELPSMTK